MASRGNILKWFKHYTNAHKGGVLQDLYCEFGINAGHGLYFRLIEFLADKWDGKSEPKFRFYSEILRNFLGFSPKKFENFAEILKKSEDISFEISGKFCEITFPKLLEVRHKDALSSNLRPDSGGPAGGPITPPRIEKKKNKSIPTEIHTQWFTELSNEYVSTFTNTTIGTKAEERFCEQITTEQDLADLRKSLINYKQSLDFDNREKNWRSAKKTFETYLGTKRSGFFWRQYLTPPNLGESKPQVLDL